jgi:uncharacterized delta-60 repeat protein
MAVQPDGKIVLVGSASQWTPYCVTPVRLHRCYLHRVSRSAAVRLDADGHPDPRFGVGGGIVDFRGSGFTSVAVLPGRGIRLGSAYGSVFRIAALDAAGNPNFGFGRDGLATSSLATANSAYLTTILSQPDGSLVVGGDLGTFSPKTIQLASSTAVAMQFSADGLEGPKLGEVAVGSGNVNLVDLVPQGDAFVAVGSITDNIGAGRASGFLARFSGGPFPYDPGFGAGAGLVELGPFPGPEGGVSLWSATADSGRVIAVGKRGSRILLARYQADGMLDQSFGEGGMVSPTVPTTLTSRPAGYEPGAVARAIAVQPDGRYVVAGSTRVDGGFFRCDVNKSPGCEQAFLARFEPDGSLDTSFGAGGFVIGGRVFSSGTSLVLQPDGKILLSDHSLRVARYNADGRLDTSFGEGGEAGVLPCQGSIAQRRRSGCLSTAMVSFKAHGLSRGRPVSQFSIRASNPLDPIGSVKLMLPAELEGQRGTAGEIRVLTVPRHHVWTKVRSRAVFVTRLGSARGIHVAIRSGVLKRIASVATAQKSLFRVEVKFKDGTRKLFGFRSPG